MLCANKIRVIYFCPNCVNFCPKVFIFFLGGGGGGGGGGGRGATALTGKKAVPETLF